MDAGAAWHAVVTLERRLFARALPTTVNMAPQDKSQKGKKTRSALSTSPLED